MVCERTDSTYKAYSRGGKKQANQSFYCSSPETNAAYGEIMLAEVRDRF